MLLFFDFWKLGNEFSCDITPYQLARGPAGGVGGVHVEASFMKLT